MSSLDAPLSGIWRSRYEYTSSSRGGTFESVHEVQLHHDGQQLVLESVPGAESYLILRLSFADGVATGTWQETTSPEGAYGGATYSGAIQLVLSGDGKRLSGKWVGVSKGGEVKTGPWEFTYVGGEPSPAGKV